MREGRERKREREGVRKKERYDLIPSKQRCRQRWRNHSNSLIYIMPIFVLDLTRLRFPPSWRAKRSCLRRIFSPIFLYLSNTERLQSQVFSAQLAHTTVPRRHRLRHVELVTDGPYSLVSPECHRGSATCHYSDYCLQLRCQETIIWVKATNFLATFATRRGLSQVVNIPCKHSKRTAIKED